jgi:hypothetical protein
MQRILLYLLTPLITFTLGVGANRLFSKAPVQTAPQRLVEIPAPADTEILAAAPVPSPTLILDYPEKPMGLLAGFYIIGPQPREFADFQFMEVGLAPDRNVSTSSIYVYEQTK